LGYQDSLSDELRHAYASSGAMHILAVSGLHVGIIYGIIVFLLSFIKSEKLKIPKVVLTIVLIWFYAALTGLSPSVGRAALMFTIIAAGKLQKHNAGSLNAIAASAFILLLINPLNIVNLGFQLSYMAVIGIVLLYDSIYKIFVFKRKIADNIWSLTAVSVAAQIVTAPLGLFYFHQFSNYFLLTNYLLIPVSTIAIWLIILVFAFSWLDFAGMFLAKILSWVVKAMNYITTGIESLPFSVSSDIYISFPQLILLYISIIFISVYFFSSVKVKHLFIGLSALVVFFGISLIQTIETKKQDYFIVYNINKTTSINIIDGHDNLMFANLDSLDKNDITFSAKNNWLKKGLEQEKYINLSSGRESLLSNAAAINKADVFYKKKFIAFKGIKIFVLDDSFKPLITDEKFKKLKLDYIVLSNSPFIKLEEISQYFEFDKLIFDSSNTNRAIEKWLDENKTLGFSIYNVGEDGAFVVNP
jgi:competence protein ComEC